jgi:hypothetical protein
MTDDSRKPAAPNGLKTSGKRLWRSVVGSYDLESHEMLLLEQACRVADLCAALQTMVEKQPLVLADRPAPAVVELRQERLVLARLVTALRIPIGDETEATPDRTQRRGMRGVYRPRGAA